MAEAEPGSRIMIVDDDEDARETLRYLLEREGYTVAAAGNGRAALELLHGGPRPCLILLDLRMPVMDGWAFLSAVERDRDMPGIPIVVVSGAHTDGAVAMRVQGVLTKPIDTRALLDTVREHCGPARRRGVP